MVKFIKPISFGCKTQTLIADLTLYCGFHAFSNTTLTSFPPAKETIYSTRHSQWGMHCWQLLAEGMWAVLGSQPGRQWGHGRYGGECSISKKHFRPGGMAPSEWTRSVRAVRDTSGVDYSAPGINTTRRVAYRPPIAVSPFVLALSVYTKYTVYLSHHLISLALSRNWWILAAG